MSTSLKVLLVDDEPSIHEGVGLSLEGVDLVAVENAAEALAHLKVSQVDVAIVDIHLPDMTGIMLAEQVLEGEHAPAVVILTAYPTFETAIAALRLGVSDYLTKPFHIDELKSAVTLAHRERTRARELAALEAEQGINLADGSLRMAKQRDENQDSD